ncbi:helix-turn-helix domain-containing protein [Streptomyces xiamenensis]
MGLRSNQSQRQRRLGHELRKLREAAGLTTAEAGRRVGLGQAHVSHIEAGRTACPEPRLRELTAVYGCVNEPLIDGLVAMTNATGKGWWTAYRDLLDDRARDLAELEHTTTAFRTFEWLYVPGLLQTPEYMRKLYANGVQDPDPGAIDKYVDFRLHRQEALVADPQPTCHAVIHEAAFHMQFVDRKTMRDQLAYLVELSQAPNITIQLLPFKAESHPVTAGSPFTIHDAGARELRTVHVEHPISQVFLHDEEQVDRFEADFQRLSIVSLEPVEPSQQHRENSYALVQHLRYIL